MTEEIKQAALEDFKVSRDGQGNLLPEEQQTKFGKVMVIPMTYGDAEEWGKKVKDKEDVSADEIAEQLRKHIVKPDMSEVTGKELREDYKAMAVNELLMAIIAASGLEEEMEAKMGTDGTARLEAKNA